MKTRWFTIAAGGCTLLFCTLAPAQDKQNKPQTAQSPSLHETAPSESARGEKLFRANCGRCHNPPESISPREARAVVRHMRVRATLTDEDERLIVKFLAP
jgi:cytochrome c5